jgi:uncharacterized protein (TIGR02145 family)
MIKFLRNSVIVLLCLCIAFLLHSCEKKKVPVLTTAEVANITASSATSGGTITDEGSDTVVSKGVCWSTGLSPTIADNKTSDGADAGTFTSNLTGLTPNTTYHLRAYAINDIGIGYGEQIEFTTLIDHDGQTGTVTDVDGNIYKTIGIGSQIWMAENLMTTKYRDATPIPNITSSLSGAYCWYNNDSATYKNTYGALYNWYAVNTGNLCPVGWHVPTYSEWNTLISFEGGCAIAGGYLKETGTAHWVSPNTGATNKSQFSALPGGAFTMVVFFAIGFEGYWWSASMNPNPVSLRDKGPLWFKIVNDHSYITAGAQIGIAANPGDMLSVRCIKN